MLHVPKLFINLVSVHKLPSLAPYKIEIGVDAHLYNKIHRWRIGFSKGPEGLYHLVKKAEDRRNSTSITETRAGVTRSTTKGEQIWLLHHQLGYLAFYTLKNMVPSLFQSKSSDIPVCEQAKHENPIFRITRSKFNFVFLNSL